jgi:hypothetical protein
MTVSSKARLAAAAAATMVAAGVGALVAAPAQAHTAKPLVPIAAKAAVSGHATIVSGHATIVSGHASIVSGHGTISAATPNVDGPCDIIDSRGQNISLCHVGTFFDGGNPYRWPVTTVDARQAANRVWFHQNPDGSGWSVCFTGGHFSEVAPIWQDPGNIFISDNTAPC